MASATEFKVGTLSQKNRQTLGSKPLIALGPWGGGAGMHACLWRDDKFL